MRKQSKSMLVLAFFIAFIAIGLFFGGMTRTVDAGPPTLCNPCDELSTINGKVDAIEGELSTLDGGVGAIDIDLEAIETDLASAQDKLDTLEGDLGAIDTELASAAEKLDKVPSAWSQILPASERFELVMGGEAVLDKETMLVWERSLDTTARDWHSACLYCYTKEVVGRLGWRLPTIEELASLVDRSVTGSPKLPSGYDAFFSNVQSDNYWSSNTYAFYPKSAWFVYLGLGDVSHGDKEGNDYYVWCVRGGQGHDAY